MSEDIQVIDVPKQWDGSATRRLRPFIEAAEKLPEGKAVVIPSNGISIATMRTTVFRIAKIAGFKMGTASVDGGGLAIWIKR